MEYGNMERVMALNSFTLTEKEKAEVLQWLVDAVHVPSINPPGQEKGMIDLVTSIADQEGLSYAIVPVADERVDIVVRLVGKKHDKPILFTGHMDVVTVSAKEASLWEYDPFGAEIVDGRLYGRGAADMKAGLMASLYALVLLKRAGIVPPQDIIFAATIDEESTMLGSKALVGNELLRDAAYCVICEPTNFHLCHEGKGRTFAHVDVYGHTAHGSMPSVGSNAIYNAMDLIEKIRHYTFPTEDSYNATFWRVLEIQAAVEPMVVPDECKFTIDARLGTKDHSARIWQTLDLLIEEVKAEHPTFAATYSIDECREPWITPKESALVKTCEEALNSINKAITYDRFQGSTDGNYFVKNGCQNVIIGPGDLAIVHQENEYVQIQDLYDAVLLYKYIMCKGVI